MIMGLGCSKAWSAIRMAYEHVEAYVSIWKNWTDGCEKALHDV